MPEPKILKGKFVLWGDGPDPCFPGFVTIRKPGCYAIAYNDQFSEHIVSRDETHWLLIPRAQSGPEDGNAPRWNFNHPVARFHRAEFHA